ncbi:MAG: hypothetical protein AAF513_15455, partial [Pseudomonadota bacterium]
MQQQPLVRVYVDQFTLTPDLLHVTLPQPEIVKEMHKRSETAVINDVCLAVAVVADAILAAHSQATDLPLQRDERR